MVINQYDNVVSIFFVDYKYRIYSKYRRVIIKRMSQIYARVNSPLFVFYCTLFMFHFLKAPLK